jgi:hypothetical protein
MNRAEPRLFSRIRSSVAAYSGLLLMSKLFNRVSDSETMMSWRAASPWCSAKANPARMRSLPPPFWKSKARK